MLKQRLLTAILMLAAVLAVIYFFPPFWYKLSIAAVCLWLSYEWVGLAPSYSWQLRSSFILLMLIVILLSSFLQWQLACLFLAAATWLLAFGLVVLYARRGVWLINNNWLHGLLGIIIISAAYHSLVLLRMSSLGANGLLSMLAVVWVMDSGAYFAGRLYGRHCLAQRVSPGKTWEGVLGGSILLSVYLLLVYFFYPLVRSHPGLLVGMLLAGAWSVVGDLLESACKRIAGVKDSGQSLPGHGGILDRLDGLLAAVPWLALCCIWLNLV